MNNLTIYGAFIFAMSIVLFIAGYINPSICSGSGDCTTSLGFIGIIAIGISLGILVILIGTLFESEKEKF